MMTIGGFIGKRITLQVADVHNPLLSVNECAGMGFGWVLAENGGFFQDRQSVEIILPERPRNLYMMRAWTRQQLEVNASQPFAGPGCRLWTSTDH